MRYGSERASEGLPKVAIELISPNWGKQRSRYQHNLEYQLWVGSV